MNCIELSKLYDLYIGRKIAVNTKAGVWSGVWRGFLVNNENNCIILVETDSQQYRINGSDIISLELK